LRANHVVLCGSVGLKSLMPRLAATMVPLTTYVITTAPLGDRLATAVRYRGGVSDSDVADNHYRVVGGDRLMLSGRATAWPRNPRRYVRTLQADIKRTYPQLGTVAIDYAWAGTLGITVHRMPQIGELGPGVWLASGFGGHGLNTTAMAGNLIARAIIDGDHTWRQFTPFELVWAGGVFGRAAAQTRVWVKRLRDAIEQRRARARELAFRQARNKAAAAEQEATTAIVAEESDSRAANVVDPKQQDGGTRATVGSEHSDPPVATPPEIAAESAAPAVTAIESGQQPAAQGAARRSGRRRKGSKAGQVAGQ
jgi:hypothetical protein